MTKDKKYLNCRTAEITDSREIAWGWYHDGDSIECWVNGRMAIRMAGLREMGLILDHHNA